MSYFPALIKLEEKKILVIGGGKIATDKISHILDFTKNITIIAPKINNKVEDFIKTYSLEFKKREYKDGDIDGSDLVVVATDDLKLQKRVFLECEKRNILCNSVDSIDYCNFIFPSYIKRGDLVISFSTSGSSPSLSKYLRRAFERLLPKDIESFLQELKRVRKTHPKGKERQKILDKKAKEYIDKFFLKDKNV